jgi:hypothetical protein
MLLVFKQIWMQQEYVHHIVYILVFDYYTTLYVIS